MFNDYLANQAAKQHIERRVQEAEAYRLHQRIGANGPRIPWQVVALVVVIGLTLAWV